MEQHKYNIGDYLFHKEKNIVMRVDSMEVPKGRSEWLYALEILSSKNKHGYWKRYYQNKIDDVCKKVTKQDIEVILYGKTEGK